MTVVYLRWRDAQHSTSQHAIADLGGLAELHEIGFLIKETPEAVTIGTEAQDGAVEARMWLTVPRVNIVEERRTSLARLFPKPRTRKKAITGSDPGPASTAPSVSISPLM